MEGRESMYIGRVRKDDVTPKWLTKTDAFLERAFGEPAKGASLVPCPYNKCANEKRYRGTYLEEWIYARLYSVDIPW
jgi:hypothetical protein